MLYLLIGFKAAAAEVNLYTVCRSFLFVFFFVHEWECSIVQSVLKSTSGLQQVFLMCTKRDDLDPSGCLFAVTPSTCG